VRVAVLASGAGTLTEAILEAGVPVAVVVTDRPCRAEAVAAAYGVPLERVDRPSFGPGFDRDGYTARLVAVLAPYRVDLVAMAGFGTVLAPAIFRAYPNRVLNSHPALLPAFPGWHAVRDALAAGARVTGCTIHVATPEVDAGPILAQEAVPVEEGETEVHLHERIKEVERRLYPETILRVLDRLPEREAEGVGR
jgi:phosphoribosylglycinamide formyltransferase-1